jgi:Domain of unknown function (DUF4926)
MATVKHAIGENDFVALTRAVNKTQDTGNWSAGTTGTVVSDYGDVKLVEISDKDGQMLDLIQAPENQLRLITKYSA